MKRLYKLTQTQFDYVVEQADSVLREYKDNISIAGIAWLHVLNSHPANQVKYVHVFDKRSFAGSVKIFLSATFRVIADVFLSLFSSFGKNGVDKSISDTEVLIISHLVNASAQKNEPDFYFKELPEYLQSKGHQTTVALLNHTHGFKDWIEANSKPVKFVVPKRVAFREEIALLRRSLKTTAFFLKLGFSEKEPVKRSFLFELSLNVFSADTLRAFRIYGIVKQAISSANIRTLILTWEGHSWERLLCYAANTAGHKVTSIGYQHTILFPSSHALKRSIGDMYDPGIILTVGSVTKNIIASSPGIGKSKVQEYGSPRLQVNRTYIAAGSIRDGCLVAPEGLVNECIILFVFGIEAAKRLPDLDFVFRTHPSMHFADLQSKDDRLQQLPSNIIISSYKNIEDDFNRCSWLLYRSSSVSLFAILNGLRPVYLQLENELSIDPLYTLNSWRLNVNRPEELVSIIDHDRQTAEQEKEIEKTEAIVFCKTYMIPYELSVMEQLISKKID
jgi:hypothetical protein